MGECICQSFLIVICRLTRNLGCRSLWTRGGTARGRFWISWFCHWKKRIGFLSHPDSSTLPQITFWPPLWKDKTTSVLKVSKEIVPDSGQVLKSKGLSRPRGRSQMNQKEDTARSILKHPDSFTRVWAKAASRCPALFPVGELCLWQILGWWLSSSPKHPYTKFWWVFLRSMRCLMSNSELSLRNMEFVSRPCLCF